MSYSKTVNKHLQKGLESKYFYLLILELFDNIFSHLAKLLSKLETVNFCV